MRRTGRICEASAEPLNICCAESMSGLCEPESVACDTVPTITKLVRR